jgi:hypothetical protein
MTVVTVNTLRRCGGGEMELRADWGRNAYAARPRRLPPSPQSQARMHGPQSRVGEIAGDIFRMSTWVSDITEHGRRHEWDQLPLPGVQRQLLVGGEPKWLKVKPRSTP